MKRLLPILVGFVVLLLSSTAVAEETSREVNPYKKNLTRHGPLPTKIAMLRLLEIWDSEAKLMMGSEKQCIWPNDGTLKNALRWAATDPELIIKRLTVDIYIIQFSLKKFYEEKENSGEFERISQGLFEDHSIIFVDGNRVVAICDRNRETHKFEAYFLKAFNEHQKKNEDKGKLSILFGLYRGVIGGPGVYEKNLQIYNLRQNPYNPANIKWVDALVVSQQGALSFPSTGVFVPKLIKKTYGISLQGIGFIKVVHPSTNNCVRAKVEGYTQDTITPGRFNTVSQLLYRKIFELFRLHDWVRGSSVKLLRKNMQKIADDFSDIDSQVLVTILDGACSTPLTKDAYQSPHGDALDISLKSIIIDSPTDLAKLEARPTEKKKPEGGEAEPNNEFSYFSMETIRENLRIFGARSNPKKRFDQFRFLEF